MSEINKRQQGLEYDSSANEIEQEYLSCKKLCFKINQLPVDDLKRRDLFKELLGSIGENFYMGANFSCDVGKNITINEDFFGNDNITILDNFHNI